MSDREDLELDALQRQLDDAFETTRPRRGFEDELWLRMQQRRPFGRRVADAFGGLIASFREAPAIPLAATALVVIVAVGVGVLNSGLSPVRQQNLSTAAGGVPKAHDSYAAGQRLPTPALHPDMTQAAPTSVSGGVQPAGAPANLYFGPATLTWTGSFSSDSVVAPVLVYGEPSDAEKRSADSAIPAAGATITIRASVPQLPLEPTFEISESAPGVAQGADPVDSANSFLAQHNLLPSWPANVVVIHSGGVTHVLFQRALGGQNGDSAYVVNWIGERYGIDVTISNGRRTAIGPLPLSYQSLGYPLISNGQAAQLAVSQPPATTQSIQPVPSVNLDHAELVYALAISGGNGFYEPAYLFSGSFQYNGQTYVKRVLVPLVDPSLRS